MARWSHKRAAVLAVMLAAFMVVSSASAVVRKGPRIYYLDVGASVSVGVQPTPQKPKGQPTNEGYANWLVTMASAKGVRLSLTQIGCPGESTLTFINGHNPCYKSVDTQLSDAVAYLKAHHTRDVLITIDMGFNNIVKCLANARVNSSCVARQLSQLDRQLPLILSRLTTAEGPNVTLVGIDHYNPYLADALNGPRGVAFAGSSTVVMTKLNTVLTKNYRSFKIPVAHVAQIFATYDHTPVATTTHGVIPTNVAKVCALTWMCAHKPYGPNIHPNDSGYKMIARAIMRALPASI
ncbi:MAG: hypothetical protein ACYC19_03005 [Acidimicrobiales bacterium]